jgi:dolichol-phosphate mannosyltransferase
MEADATSDIGALPTMLDEIGRGADVVLADWQMVGVSAHRRLLSAGAGWVVRKGLGLQATTVSSFFRVYRASTLREASSRYGDRLIRERGFACKAELLAKLSAMQARIVEVPVALDWSRRNGESKMPVLKTMLAYWRMLVRERGTVEPVPAPDGVAQT